MAVSNAGDAIPKMRVVSHLDFIIESAIDFSHSKGMAERELTQAQVSDEPGNSCRNQMTST